MRYRIWAIGLMVAMATGRWAAAQESVSVHRITYHGWPGAYRLSNGTVELVYVPQIGRIMEYAFVGGPNVLWENRALWGKTVKPASDKKDWTNFGGDKIWPAPQDKWNWPPDSYLDPGIHTVQVLPSHHLLVIGQPSKKHGIRFTREIALAATGTGVVVRNSMENVSDQDVEWSIWEVTQIDDPTIALLPVKQGSRFSTGYYDFKDPTVAHRGVRVTGGRVSIRRDAKKAGKIGTDSPAGWAAGIVKNMRLTVSASYEEGQEYPDSGCVQESYSDPDPDRYMELELLGGIHFLQPGDKSIFTTRWKLEKVAR